MLRVYSFILHVKLKKNYTGDSYKFNQILVLYFALYILVKNTLTLNSSLVNSSQTYFNTLCSFTQFQ